MAEACHSQGHQGNRSPEGKQQRLTYPQVYIGREQERRQ